MEKAAARQKIRPELLQAVNELEQQGKEIIPAYGRRMASDSSIIKIKFGKVKVLVSLEQGKGRANVGSNVVKTGGKIRQSFEPGNTVFAEVPLEKLEEIAANYKVKEICPDFELMAMEEPLEQINTGLSLLLTDEKANFVNFCIFCSNGFNSLCCASACYKYEWRICGI